MRSRSASQKRHPSTYGLLSFIIIVKVSEKSYFTNENDPKRFNNVSRYQAFERPLCVYSLS